MGAYVVRYHPIATGGRTSRRSGSCPRADMPSIIFVEVVIFSSTQQKQGPATSRALSFGGSVICRAAYP
jgi:hypothetical protein